MVVKCESPIDNRVCLTNLHLSQVNSRIGHVLKRHKGLGELGGGVGGTL